MKITVFLASGLSSRGGVERATISLVNSLAEKPNIDISILTFKDTDKPLYLNKSIVVKSLRVGNYKKEYFTVLKGIFSSLKDTDIFISVETISLLFSFIPYFLRKNTTKLVVWEHFNYRNDNGRKLRRLFRVLAARKSDLIVLLTDRDVKEWKKNMLINSKITYIYNINTFKRDDNIYNLNSKTIIAIGRYTQVKGFDRLVKIWGMFQDKYNNNDWKLEIVGYGQEKSKLEALITELEIKNIRLVDGDNVEKNYADASFYCMTSYYEGLPMVLIEAQSFGLPAISFDIFTGPSEILDDSTGILVTDGDLESYSDAIHKLITDSKLRLTMSSAAFEASKRFSEDAISERWVNELNMVNKL